MHSRIIELSMEPIDANERICESDYYDNGFIGSIADYVNGDTDRDDDINWFTGYLKGKDIIAKNDNVSFTFSNNIREKYFKEKFETLKDLVSNISLEEFSTDSVNVYRMKSYIEEKYEFYIHYDGFYYPLDEFIRHVEDGQTWYFGGTLDYHF